ncbi:MAG: hypothetical protein MJ201_05560, partial [Mycoplasmoidaceae bacterium]|nr:hypothetical protein [Mycoplasmoidaceae bacterium]
MKKLHILIPSLVATASMPLVSLVGCGNPDTPTPPEPEPEPVIDYTVTQEEMESAIGMDDIVFLQLHSEINMMLQSQLWQTISDVDYSPDAMYESLEEQGGELSLNQKKYIVHDNERFIQYSIGGVFDD